ncbi:MAG: PIN domain-containing protein [Chthoniobacterales bacterium]
MGQVIDSCIWVDLFRPNTKEIVRSLADEVVSRPSIALCEPITFELFRLASHPSRKFLEIALATVPVLTTPSSLWNMATRNGQCCREKGIQAGAMDLLIATICKHHHATLVTFDVAFEKIANVLQFPIEIITR